MVKKKPLLQPDADSSQADWPKRTNDDPGYLQEQARKEAEAEAKKRRAKGPENKLP